MRKQTHLKMLSVSVSPAIIAPDEEKLDTSTLSGWLFSHEIDKGLIAF